MGVAQPAALGALYRDLLSPYCPGLSLASCPSPQADSLRKAIAVRFANGETPEAITSSLVVDFGPSIRGSPTMDGFGAAAFIAPVLLLVGGALVAQRWLRRHTRRGSAGGDAHDTTPTPSGRALSTLLLVGAMAATALAGGLTACAPGDGSGDGSSGGSGDSGALVARTEPWADAAWVRVGDSGAVTGAYVTIHNPTGAALRIVGGTSPLADTVELHETMQHDGMVHMAPQPALEVGAGDSVVLAPGGKHLMVRELRRALVVGETLPITLHFDGGTTLRMDATVRPISGLAGPDSATDGDPRNVDSLVEAIRSCPRDGRWHACSVEQRLRLAGLRVVALDTATRIPGVEREAITWQAGGQSLRAVLFATTQEADAAFGRLDSARAAPRGDSSVVWTQRVSLLRNANLLAIFFGGSDRAIERVGNALTAGPPQPDR